MEFCMRGIHFIYYSSLEAYQYQIDNERGTKTEQLVSAAPVSDDIRFSIFYLFN
jgi:hypothetical protein